MDPPPFEPGDESLYRVVYIIDVNATNPRAAAEQVHEIMSDPASMAPVLHIIDRTGRTNTIDLDQARTALDLARAVTAPRGQKRNAHVQGLHGGGSRIRPKGLLVRDIDSGESMMLWEAKKREQERQRRDEKRCGN